MPRKRKARLYPPNNRRKQKCDACNILFNSLNELFSHAKGSDNEECLATIPYCKPCDKPFQTFDGLHKHFRTCPNNGIQVHNHQDSLNVVDQTEYSNVQFNYHHDTSRNQQTMYASTENNSLHVEQHVTIHNNNKYNLRLLPSSGVQISSEVYNSSTKFVFDNHKVHLKIQQDEASLITDESSSLLKAKFFNNFFSNYSSIFNKPCTPLTMKQCSIHMHGIIADMIENSNLSCLLDFDDAFPSLDSVDDTSLYQFLWRYCNTHHSNTNLDTLDIENDREENDIFGTCSSNDSYSIEYENDNVNNNEENVDIINNRMSHIQNAIEKHQIHCKESLTNRDVALLELHRMLQKARAPMYLFDQISKWSQKHNGVFGTDGTTIPSKEKFTKDIANKIYTKEVAETLRPIKQSISLSPTNSVSLTRFSFEAHLINLLMNNELMQEENLLLNLNNPFDSVPPENCVLDDLNSGWWYRETHAEICQKENEILLPLVFFIDGGKVTERLSIEPIVFTLGIFNRKTRNKPNAWRTLGYIESFKNFTESKFTHNSNIPTHEKWDAYHKIIAKLLSDVVPMLGIDGGFSWVLDLLGKKYNVVFKLAIEIILGDSEGLSKLCLHFGKTNSKVLCRDCMVSYEDSDDPYHKCVFTTKFHIFNKTKKELNDICKHHCDNAFLPCYFGARNLSVYESTPPEPLHAIQLGLFVYQYKQFMSVASGAMEDIEDSIQYLYQKFSRQSDRSLPSLQSIQNSVRNPGTLSATNQYDRTFATYLALLSPDVFECLCNSIHGGYETAKKWFYLFQRGLSFYQWIMKPTHSKLSLTDTDTSESVAQIEIRAYLSEYKDLVGNRQGTGCKFSKFHHTLHYINNMIGRGSMINADTGRPESNAVSMYKNFAHMTQRRQGSIVSQIAQRHFEDLVMSDAIRILIDDDEDESITNEENGTELLTGSQYTISVSYDDELNAEGDFVPTPTVSFRWDGNSQSEERFPPNICLAIAKRLYQTYGEGGSLNHDCVPIGRTEFIDKKGIRYRAHPNYHGDEWFDWCLIKWNHDDVAYPAKIITFIDLSECNIEYILDDGPIEERETYLDRRTWVIVHSGEDVPVRINDQTWTTNNDLVQDRNRIKHSLDPVIGKRFRLEKSFRIIDIQQIVGPCYCVPETHYGDSWNYSEFVCLNSIDTWYKGFINE